MCSNVTSLEWLLETSRRYLGKMPLDDEGMEQLFNDIASSPPDKMSKLSAAQQAVMLDNATTLTYAAAEDYYLEWASLQSRGRFRVFNEVLFGSYLVVRRRLMEPCGTTASDRTDGCRSSRPDTSDCCTPHGFLPALPRDYEVVDFLKDLCPPFHFDPDFRGHVVTLPSSDPSSNYGYAQLTVARLALAQSLSLIDASAEQVEFLTVLSNPQQNGLVHVLVSVILEIELTGDVTGSLEVQVLAILVPFLFCWFVLGYGSALAGGHALCAGTS
jgi:hypothetical protein